MEGTKPELFYLPLDMKDAIDLLGNPKKKSQIPIDSKGGSDQV